MKTNVLIGSSAWQLMSKVASDELEVVVTASVDGLAAAAPAER
jgi:hypothetical protein